MANLSAYFIPPSSTGGRYIDTYQYTLDGGSGWDFISPESTVSPITSIILQNGVVYPFGIRPWTISGPGPSSQTYYLYICATSASVPEIITVGPRATGIELTITPPLSYNGGTFINYQYTLNGGTSWSTRYPSSTSSPLHLYNLTVGIVYNIAVRGLTKTWAGVLTGLPSNIITATPSVLPSTPGSPTIDAFEGGANQITIFFTPPSNDGGFPITNYEYSLASDPVTTNWAPRSPVSLNTIWVITGLTNGNQYYLRIRAVSQLGGGGSSNAVAFIAGQTLTAPTITSVTPGNTIIDINFTPPSQEGGSAVFNYEYSLDGGTTWNARNPASIFSPLQVTGLSQGVTYYVKIRAVNLQGSGPASNEVTVTTGAVTDPYFANVTFLIRGDSTDTYKDLSNKQGTWIGTLGPGVSFDSVIKQYGNGSIKNDNTSTSSYVTYDMTGKNPFNFGTGDFTIEFWVYFDTWPTGSSFNRMFGFNNSTNPMGLEIGGSTFKFNVGSGYFINITNTGFFSSGTWTHVAITRESGVIYLYINGVKKSQASNNSNITHNGAVANAYIGGYASGSVWNLKGNFCDLRVTSGIARYLTANAPFTPPQDQFPSQ